MRNEGGILIFIPTYNEAPNVSSLYNEIAELNLDADVLFVDDNSPDGTGKIIDQLSAASDRVYALHRSGKLGIGSAHLDGIRWAYKHGYNKLITMDCDFTHSPSAILDFLKRSDHCDLVVGSRFLREDSLPNWNLLRKVLTYGGHWMTRLMLRMPLDATGAFRLYRLDRIPEGIFDLVVSRSYSFFFETLYLMWLNGVVVQEIPVSLPARTQGHSKMAVRDAVQSLKTLTKLFIRRCFQKNTLRYQPNPLGAVISSD